MQVPARRKCQQDAVASGQISRATYAAQLARATGKVELTAVKQTELMSSRSSTKAMRRWARPMRYLPALTLSNFSNCSWHTKRSGMYVSIATMPTSWARAGAAATGLGAAVAVAKPRLAVVARAIHFDTIDRTRAGAEAIFHWFQGVVDK
jgi:hypothetical protein